MSEQQTIQLYGRVFITGIIEAKTGLHIGGSETAVAIGGVDNTIIRDPLTGRPYIPGSSLKGKMRSLTEKHLGLPQNQRIGQIRIHVALNEKEYAQSPVSHIYGIPANDFSLPTRLAVRDVPLTQDSATILEKARTDLPYTEVKTEVAIDRVTSAAVPRQLERVPAGAEFGPFELVFSLFDPADADLFAILLDGLTFVEDDYLGGSGTRGSGKVAFTQLQVTLKSQSAYHQPKSLLADEAAAATLADLNQQRPAIQQALRQLFATPS
jgi:CRISPR-associated protein Csm3